MSASISECMNVYEHAGVCMMFVCVCVYASMCIYESMKAYSRYPPKAMMHPKDKLRPKGHNMNMYVNACTNVFECINV